MNIETVARRALVAAALLSGGAVLPAAGTLAAYASEGNVWVLTLAQDLKAGRLVMASAGASVDSGSAISKTNQSWNLIPGRPYQLHLDGLVKSDAAVEFRLSNTKTPGYVRLVMELGDGNSAVNPIYKAVIKKFRASVLYKDPASSSGGQMVPTNWGDFFDLPELDKGDITIKAKDLSILH